MNEELQKLGTQALTDLLANLTSAKEFILAQAPDICQQMVLLAIVKGCISAIWLLIPFSIAIRAGYYSIKTAGESELDSDAMLKVFFFVMGNSHYSTGYYDYLPTYNG